MKIIGITGTIGSGKTTTSSIIKNLGYNVFESDIITKKLYKKNKVKKIIVNIFGKKINNLKTFRNEINLNLLGNHVFGDKSELIKLENILHPLIFKEKEKFIKKNLLKKKDKIFLDIPLLFKSKSYKECDYIINVHVKKSIQKQRVLRRLHMTEEKFKNILKHQKLETSKFAKYISISINTGNDKKYVEKTLLNFLDSIR